MYKQDRFLYLPRMCFYGDEIDLPSYSEIDSVKRLSLDVHMRLCQLIRILYRFPSNGRVSDSDSDLVITVQRFEELAET